MEADAPATEPREGGAAHEPGEILLPSESALRDLIRERVIRHFLPVETTVLGVHLRRLSLWHWRALDGIGSPCIPDGSWLASIGDLCAAVHVLTLPPNYEGSLRPRGLRWHLRAAYFGRRLAAELDVLADHVFHDFDGPVKGRAEGSTSPVQVPGWLYLAAQLIDLGIPPAEAWAITPGHARTLLEALDVVRGGPDFLGASDALNFLQAGWTLEDLGLC